MLIPLGHEKTAVRRLPWVTFVVMALCLIIFLFTHPGEQSRMEGAFEDLGEAFEYFGEHPYLVMDPRLEEFLNQEFGSDGTISLLEMMRQAGPKPPTDQEVLQREQETFNGLVDVFTSTVEDSPLRILGVVPANIRVPAFITYICWATSSFSFSQDHSSRMSGVVRSMGRSTSQRESWRH
jgi:hypothetical protein